ncbi:uncharacterized protein LOC123527412 isoform X2 [Mercenaria mercenaria]|uniref:uncharacterized protein LOC123527412 isoform X2 n=1 Tax=Mercenaria mercenaria TaxID=6596 RepID=UPI00234FAA21|nr:uncharacterized protein LOC123527412 isoform X2 [Mercenaria mercenaria]
MSIAFREVFKEFSTVTNDNSSLIRKDRISDAFHLGEKLLLSSNNMRPKSRSKTSLGSCELFRVSPEWRLQYSNSASAKIIRHTTGDVLMKGRRSRKRNCSNGKNKKGKHGCLLTAATGLHDKTSSVHSRQILTNTQHEKPSRISSEPPSKVSQGSVLSNTQQDPGNGLAQKRVYNVPFSNKKMHDIYPIRVASAKTNSSSLPSTHYIHGNLTCNPIVNNLNSASCLESADQPVMIYKLDINKRVKSASSLKLDVANKPSKEKDDTEVVFKNSEEISVNAVSCNLQLSHKLNKSVIKYQQKNLYSTQGLSADSVSKEAVLTSIYGAVYHTADKVSAQAEELKKVKKIFLSEKQSGTIRESGMEFPCAPPATPTPDLLRKHEYVPSMSDIRSQRAVKSRLQVMEKEALKKQEKQKEANAKLEKQQLKDKEKQMKAKQRKEIYALNKIMTELENKRFMDFCQAKGLNKL